MNTSLTMPRPGRKAAIEASATRPKALPVHAEGIPQPLKDRPQWVAWAYRRRGQKWTKVPINPRTGRAADVSNPGTWGSFAEALTFAEARRGQGADGIGFVFTDSDPFAGIDLDVCKGCELCAAVCPVAAIEMEPE